MFSQFELHKHLVTAIQDLGFEKPTPVQEEVIPLALEQADLRISAETGSGKTVAFLLPTLQQLLRHRFDGSGARALILVPTRELASQVYAACRELTLHTNLRQALITGGDNFGTQMKLLELQPEVVIATPGRLVKLLEQGSADFSHLEVLVLDEADRMLDMGFSDDVMAIVEQCSPNRQSMLLSATLGHKGLRGLADAVLTEPEEVTLSTVQEKHSTITHQIVLADDIEHKLKLLSWLLENETYGRCIVFANSREHADKIGGVMVANGRRVGVLHGDKDQNQRNRVMSLLHAKAFDVLIATDVAARGLDIDGVDLVINFDMPRRGDGYVHRTGRTGRAGREGLAISLISSLEWNLMASIERYLRQSFERRGIKELRGSYKGPKKLKASGKAAGSKKKKKNAKKKAVGKAKRPKKKS
ncbi:MAG: DEAD/DEAH box helicase [Pseudomonadota bacterium]